MNARHTVRTIATAERGAALVMTLLVLIILTAFGLTLVAVGMTEMAISSNWRDYSKDFYAAEAALESGVVALRNLLATTPTPTQPQLNTIATAPTLSDTRMTFGAYTITPASPAPSRQTFATGPYNGLFGWGQGYAIQAQVNGQGGTRANLTQMLQYTRVPLFQFGIFYGKGVDLEIRPGPAMTFNGKIFANSNIYIAAGTTLQITDSVKTAGNIYRSIKSEPAYPNYNNPQIEDATNTLRTLDFDHTYKPGFGATWSPGEWATQAMQTFGGTVQDSAMGVGQIIPPLPDLFGNPSNPVVRLVNGSRLPDRGLTVVSQNPVYITGDYNTVPVGANHPPAAVLGDAVTVLSNAWQQNNYDTKGNQAFQNRVALATTVNAAIATGPSSESSMGRDNGKANNLVRFLEDWTNKTFSYSGSMLSLWHSQQATGDWRCCGAGGLYYYAPPNRVWGYDTLFDTTQPPGTPMGIIMTKGSWSQS